MQHAQALREATDRAKARFGEINQRIAELHEDLRALEKERDELKALLLAAGVPQAAVRTGVATKAVFEPAGDTKIGAVLAFVRAHPNGGVTIEQIRRHLRDKYPDMMMSSMVTGASVALNKLVANHLVQRAGHGVYVPVPGTPSNGVGASVPPPPPPPTPKAKEGYPPGSHKMARDILDHLRTRDIARVWGLDEVIEWAGKTHGVTNDKAGRHQVAENLNRLHKRGFLVRIRRGSYQLATQ